MNLENILRELYFNYRFTVNSILLLLAFILSVVFVAKIWDICNYKKEQTELLERIAKALEQDSEPYIIENKEEDT